MKKSIQKIIIVAAVLFSAGLSNISANAQQAEMQVYEPVGNVMMLNTASNFIPVDVSGSLDDVLDLLQTETGWGQQYLNFSLLTNGMTIAASREQNNLPAIAGSINRELQSRDVVRFVDSVAATPITDITVRIYNKGGSDIFMAIGEESQTLAAAVSGDEFFIRSDTGELMTTPHRMNIGYQLTCDPATPIMETDGLSCREIESAADCPVATPDFVNGNCVPACLDTETRNSAGDCEMIPQDDMEMETEMEEMENEMEEMETEMEEMETEMEESQNTQLQPQTISSGKPKEFAYIGAGVFIVGFAASYIAGGGFPIFTYSPDFGYSLTESGYSANVGGRADFRKDNWHLYYFANQTNANGDFGDFRYTSGGRYNGDLFVATFSESDCRRYGELQLFAVGGLDGAKSSYQCQPRLSPALRI